VLNHKDFFTSGFPSQFMPLCKCLALDLSLLGEFSWLLSLTNLCSRFPCKECFLISLDHFLCSAKKSKYVILSFLLPWLSTSDCGSDAYLFFSLIFIAKQQNIITIHKTLILTTSFCILS